jgi:hypothetical protein
MDKALGSIMLLAAPAVHLFSKHRAAAASAPHIDTAQDAAGVRPNWGATAAAAAAGLQGVWQSYACPLLLHTCG